MFKTGASAGTSNIHIVNIITNLILKNDSKFMQLWPSMNKIFGLPGEINHSIILIILLIKDNYVLREICEFKQSFAIRPPKQK